MIDYRIQEFSSGGRVGGVQVNLAYKKSSENFFLFLFFLVLNLFYRSPVVTFKENYYLPRFQWGWNIFQGVQLFTGWGAGGPITFLYRNPYNLCFSRGVRTPSPPLWIRPCDSVDRGIIYLLVFLFSFYI